MIDTLTAAAAALSGWEATAVVLGVAYLLLAMRENALCWYAAFGSTAIYLLLFWHVGLVMESLLQLYYLGMAAYGLRHWRRGGDRGNSLPISRWTPQRHLLVILCIVASAGLIGFVLSRFTDAALPYLDSFTTVGAVVTTWMVAHKVLENWLYWFVIDAMSMWLYIDRGLYLTAVLFAVYLVIVIFGFMEWRKHYQTQFH